MAVTEVERFLAVGRFEAERVGERVPAPVAHGTEGNALFVILDVCLHTRYIDGCGKVAVTNGERCQWVCIGNDRVVTKKNSLAIYRGCYVFCGVSKHLHLQGCPDERPDAFSVVVADGFREIVFKAAITTFVLLDSTLGVNHLQGCLHFWCGGRTEAGNLAAIGQRDGLVGIDTDEVVDDALVGLDTSFTVFVAYIAFAIGFQQYIGEHRRASRL